jgi:hypothetical protein
MAATRLTAKPGVRLGFVYVPNGIISDQWTPTTEGANFAFRPTMAALEPFRDRLLVLSGLAQVTGRALGDGPGDHARAGATWLTGVHPKRSETDIHAGISADQIAAREFGKETQFGSLELGLEAPSLAGACDQNYSCAYTNTVSWRTPTTPNPMEVSPRVVFERLFGDGDSTDAASRMALMKEQSSILDFVKNSVDRLEGSLGARDRNKLTEYLEAVRDIERRIQLAETQNAEMKLPDIQRPSSIPEEFEDHAKLMMDMMVVAWQTNMTRVTTLMMAREGSNRPYRAIGIPDGHHSCTHHQNDPEKIAKTAKINQYHVVRFAYLLDRLKNTPDGDGNLLDHSLIVYGSSISDGNIHTHHDLPIALVGGGNGTVQGGRHIRYAKETPMNNMLLTLLDKAGVPAEKFGDATGEIQGLSL